jgi:transcriptional regulator with XRE-family HTH domain
MSGQGSFAARLRAWRQRRGVSQLELAARARISQRHVSFLETGRTAPSREMVLHVAAALELPLRQQNALLRAAGFAPIWSESALGAPELAAVNQALDFMLAQQEPYPAFVVDRRWNLLRANAAAVRFVTFLTGSASAPDAAVNLADALIAPEGLRPLIANWREVALYFVRSVQADALADGTEETEALLRRLVAYPGIAAMLETPTVEHAPAPILTMRFIKDGTALDLFTTIATLGTPQDVTLQEMRVENFFPADAETAAMFKRWAKAAAQRHGHLPKINH